MKSWFSRGTTEYCCSFKGFTCMEIFSKKVWNHQDCCTDPFVVLISIRMTNIARVQKWTSRVFFPFPEFVFPSLFFNATYPPAVRLKKKTYMNRTCGFRMEAYHTGIQVLLLLHLPSCFRPGDLPRDPECQKPIMLSFVARPLATSKAVSFDMLCRLLYSPFTLLSPDH